ncbi:MAG: hypothetical protein LBH06_00090 [Rikenellaceae bacterium]|jgi:hypothetical protein|nr:hypothetical protein [Rikenellaceae bacterium]
MKTYFRRAGAYFLKTTLLLAALFGIMTLSGTSAYGPQELLAGLFGSTKGALLLAALLLASLVNPKIGFVTRRVGLDLAARRDEAVRTMLACGYSLASESGSVLIFRADNPAKRAWLLWDDAITLARDGHSTTISGPRKEIIKAEYSLNALT